MSHFIVTDRKTDYLHDESRQVILVQPIVQ